MSLSITFFLHVYCLYYLQLGLSRNLYSMAYWASSTRISLNKKCKGLLVIFPLFQSMFTLYSLPIISLCPRYKCWINAIHIHQQLTCWYTQQLHEWECCPRYCIAHQGCLYQSHSAFLLSCQPYPLCILSIVLILL